MIATCKSCGASIKFVKMVSGKSMPVDITPIKKIVQDPEGPYHSVCDCYTSHFETCPSAQQHRKINPAIIQPGEINMTRAIEREEAF